MNSKRNDKIKIGLALGLLLSVIIVFVFLILKKPNDNEVIMPEVKSEIAELMFVSNTNGIHLVDINGTILASTQNATSFVKNDINNEILYEKNGDLYSLSYTMKEETNEEGIKNEVYSLIEELVLDLDLGVYVDSFVFNDDYVAFLTKVEMSEDIATKENKEDENIGLKDKIEIDSNTQFYNINIINRKDKTIKTLENINLDECVLFNNEFVYSVDNYLISYNLETEENKELYLGKLTSDLFVYNNKLIVFNKFGNGNNKSLIMQLTNNLYIEKTSKHESIDIIAISFDENEENIVYIDNSNKLFYRLNLNEEREIKDKVNLNINNVDGSYNKENTYYANNYIYTTKSGKLDIIALKSSTVYKSLDIEATNVFPIFEEDTLEEVENVVENSTDVK